MTGLALLLCYAAFASIAILANLATQRLMLVGFPKAYVLALVGGTTIGLVVKYALDKKWIFNGVTHAQASPARTFGLYALTGIVTTLIFWGLETAAWLIWQTHLAREAGAVVGLLLGYVLKYRLDRRYVFTQQLPA